MAKTVPDKYERILDAAVKVFAKKGFFHSKVSDVSQQAEVADGTIYLYFKNKDDLLISIFERSMRLFINTVTDELKKIPDPVARFKRFVVRHLELVQENQDLAHVLQIELRQSSKFMEEYDAGPFFDYLVLIENMIREGQKQGVFRADIKPEIAKRAIFGAVDEMALEWILMRKKRYALSEAASQVAQLFLTGLEAQKK